MARRQALADQQRQFLDDASHQLRTPLTTLRTQAVYALRHWRQAPAHPEVGEGLQAIVGQIDAATRGANQLLSLARSDAADPQWVPFDLAEMLRQLVRPLLRRARERGLDLGVDAPEALPAQGDETLWREAVANLLDNALRYARRGTPVTAMAREEADAMGQRCWVITVSSEGEPLAEALRQQLAQAEQTVSPDAGRFVRGQGSRQGGAGLGLAIARRVAQRHGGGLQIDARESGGFEARLHWPVQPGRH